MNFIKYLLMTRKYNPNIPCKDLIAEAGLPVYRELRKRKVPHQSALIMSFHEDARDLGAYEIAKVFHKLTKQYAVPEEAAEIIAPSHGFFRESKMGLLRVATRFHEIKHGLKDQDAARHALF